jgi:hypothetical protein
MEGIFLLSDCSSRGIFVIVRPISIWFARVGSWKKVVCNSLSVFLLGRSLECNEIVSLGRRKNVLKIY